MARGLGDVLAGKYELVAELGRGGMGTIYRARHRTLGTEVAVKLLHEDLAARPDIVERFLREARAATLVRHPNVVEMLDVGKDERGPFIVQELLVGENLEEYVRARGGRLGFEEAVEILSPVIEAVAEAHASGVVHRDIKPENVFVATARGARVPKLLDFGISQIRAGDTRVTATGVTMGTPAYMAPEQIRATHKADARSDVWSLGVVLFELLSGRLPFVAETQGALFVAIATQEAPPLTSAWPEAPANVTRIVGRCLRADPATRYPSASELLRDLHLALVDEDIEPTQRHSLPPRLRAPDLDERVEVIRIGAPPAPVFEDTMASAGAPAVPDLELPAPRVAAPRPRPEPPPPKSDPRPLELEESVVGRARAAAASPPAPADALGPHAHAMDAHAVGGPAPNAAPPLAAPSPAAPPAPAPARPPESAPTPAPETPRHLGRASAPDLYCEANDAPAAPIDLESTDMRAGLHAQAAPRARPVAVPSSRVVAASHAGAVAPPDTQTILGMGALGLGAILGAGGMMKVLHREGGWPLHAWLELTTLPPVGLGVVGLVAIAAGAYGVIQGARARRVPLAMVGVGVALTGALLAGEAAGLGLAGLTPLGPAVAALGVSGMVLSSALASWQSFGGKAGAVLLALAGGGALFVAVELFAGMGGRG